MQQHPLSAAFPAMADEDYQALKASIKEIGVQNPITFFEGKIIDGWHRYKATQELGILCPNVGLVSTVDPREFVMAQNKARRHTTQAQLALAAAAVYEWRPMGANQHAGRVGTQCPPSKSTAELASISGVGERTIKQAKSVQRQAAPEVIEAVKTGKIGLTKAAAIAKLPQEQQAAAINQPLPKPKPALAPEPEPLCEQPQEAYTELDAARDHADYLQGEVARLKLLVPAEAAEGEAMLEGLRQEMRNLQETNRALTLARDRLQAENAELKKQCAWLKKQLDKKV